MRWPRRNWSDGEARAFAVRLDAAAQATGLHRKGGDATLLLLFNAYHDLVTFNLPETVGGEAWTRLLDTNLPTARTRRASASRSPTR